LADNPAPSNAASSSTAPGSLAPAPATAASPRNAAIVVRNLTRRFGQFVAVDSVSFDVARGEIFGFLGSNGAGKSTTIRMLCGLLKPTSGTATVGGVDVTRDPEAVKRRIGYMSQRFSLYELLTVDQNIAFFGGVYGLSHAKLAERRRFVIEMAGLAGREQTLARDLAGGWRQRLALGCAILHEPALLFLDEPTGGVDPLSRRQFWRLIDTLSQSGVTVLVTTHYLDEAERCHRVALIHAGRLATIGSTTEVKQCFAGRPILEIRADKPVDAMRLLDGFPEVEKTSLFGTAVHAVLRSAAVTPEAIAERLRSAGVRVETIAAVAPSLEDVFLDVIDRAAEKALRQGSGQVA
jgi:ABC-2 type transport system ATP-binding protein